VARSRSQGWIRTNVFLETLWSDSGAILSSKDEIMPATTLTEPTRQALRACGHGQHRRGDAEKDVNARAGQSPAESAPRWRAELVEPMRHALGRNPHDAELARVLGVSAADLDGARSCSARHHAVSLDQRTASRAALADTLHRSMASLTERQRLVVRLRFVDELSQAEIGRDRIRSNGVGAS
jgi:DNA-directed RNA polymerase specialized sigma24 family protein